MNSLKLKILVLGAALGAVLYLKFFTDLSLITDAVAPEDASSQEVVQAEP